MKTAYLLDALALLAALFREPGADRVAEVLERSAISAVNLYEVVTRQVRLGAKAELAVANLERLNLPVIAWDEELALAAADLSPLAVTHGLSLGDRACLATARLRGWTALTADRDWANLPPLGFPVEIVR